ncbi:hypothetical protein GWK08_02185 [Leptobacterium flavescens]|uniref:Lipocalin-like domain-containing protein n=1 Tax=Leptobacterium flavescens TaxID=472055 RepID=A0A6P0UIF7_9FLAO|nr:hypothetical protein [Leptobacterium flavescens]NER12240.1 hypothetical protein [Leptobacterium flavescens]
MKYFKLLIVAFVFTFAACTSDDNEADFDSANLPGTWNLSGVTTQNGSAVVTQEGVTVTVDFSLSTSNEDLQVVFSENPNTVSSSGSFVQILTITAFGQTETEEEQVDGLFLDGTWQLNGSTLTIDSDDSTLEEFGTSPSFTVTQLTENSLEIRLNLDQEIMFNGETAQTTGTVIINFTR